MQGIPPDPIGTLRSRPLWALLLSLLLHVALFTGAVTLSPMLGALVRDPRAGLPVPQVLTFRFRERTADVTPDSRTATPPETPLLGRFASRARDLVRDAQDTPVPAGRAGLENELPGQAGAGEGGGGEAAAAAARRAAEASAPGGVRPSVVDAMHSSEIAMLTGRPDAPRRGREAEHEAEFGLGGALEFGDYAFSTRAWDYEPYWHYMRERLYANWHPPAAYRDYGIIQGGWTLVRASLDRRGRLRHAEILGEQGHRSLHVSSLAAMQGAAPFRPLPADFPDDSLVVTVKFIYMPPGQRPPEP